MSPTTYVPDHLCSEAKASRFLARSVKCKVGDMQCSYDSLRGVALVVLRGQKLEYLAERGLTQR